MESSPRKIVPCGTLSNISTMRIVYTTNGHVTQAAICPSGNQMRLSNTASPPRIITAGWAGG